MNLHRPTMHAGSLRHAAQHCAGVAGERTGGPKREPGRSPPRMSTPSQIVTRGCVALLPPPSLPLPPLLPPHTAPVSPGCLLALVLLLLLLLIPENHPPDAGLAEREAAAATVTAAAVVVMVVVPAPEVPTPVIVCVLAAEV